VWGSPESPGRKPDFLLAQMKIKPVSIRILTVCYVCVLAGIIFVADTKSTRYVLRFVGNIPFGDKLGHFFLFGTFALLLNLSFSCRKVWGVLLGSLIVFAIVTAEEFSQIFIRGRSFDLTDLIADLFGIILFGKLAEITVKNYFAEENKND
jgi:polysaccharide biosynthesis protein VpsQ